VEELGVKNVEFRAGDIEDMPIEDESIDVVISNCAINLVPDKNRVFREAYRVLKPGGRMIISDIVTEGELPKKVRDDVEAWAACIGGALPEKEYIQSIRRAGFVDVNVVSKARSALYRAIRSRLINRFEVINPSKEMITKNRKGILQYMPAPLPAVGKNCMPKLWSEMRQLPKL